MKIYFEDSDLLQNPRLPVKADYIIDAKMGYSSCLAQFEYLYRHNADCVVYTNSLTALMDNKFFWDKETNIPQLYLRYGEYIQFRRVDNLTERELKESHNFLHLFTQNEFGTLN